MIETAKHTAAPGDALTSRERWLNVPNAITWVRILSGLAIFTAAAHQGSMTLNYVGLGVYWSLDVLDGAAARALGQETRLGAQLDILGDRLLVAFFYLNYVDLRPEALVPAALFLFDFMLVDHFLSNQFMRWRLLSPNYFHRVDPLIWRLNWSVPGKVVNSALVTGLLLLTDWIGVATAACLGVIGIKLFSMWRLQQLPPPEVDYPPPPGAP